MGEGLQRAFKAIRDHNKAIKEAQRAAKQQARADAAGYFVKLLARGGVPAPVAEYVFHPRRRWRFDFAWPDQKVALEVDGGIWTQGRHTRGAGWLKDTEKLNAAAMFGWRLLRCTPDMMELPGLCETIACALEYEP